MDQYDVVVVGAGPAGSTAAYHLAQQGRRVLLAEEHAQVGKPVQCAGLVSRRVLEMAGTRRMVLHEVRGATVWGPSLRPLTFKADETRAYVLDRGRLDLLLAERAARAGAQVESGWRFVGRGAHEGPSPEVLRFETLDGGLRTVGARLVIGADGVTSAVARAFRLRRPVEILPAYEAEMEFPDGDRDLVEVYLGNRLSPGLFGWWVPDGQGRARVGVAIRADTGHTARDYYRALARQLERRFGHPLAAPVEIIVAGIPIGHVPRTHGDRVLLVGDAAAQVKPLSGGGIFTGMRCAEIAASVAGNALAQDRLDAATLAEYDRRWSGELGAEFEKALFLRRLFLRLNDAEMDRLLDVLHEKDLLGGLVAFGDIDFPSLAAGQLLRRSPSLVKFFPKAFAAYLRREAAVIPDVQPSAG